MTTSAVVYTFLFVHVGVILVVTAYYTLGAAIAPRITERGRVRFGNRPWLPVLIGLGLSVPWVAAALVLLNLPAGGLKFAGAALGCLWVLLALIGGSGIAQHVGHGSNSGPVTWMQTARGGLLLSLTWILPLVGWLGMLPLTLAAGIGCLVMGAIPIRQQPMPAAGSR